MGKNSPSSQDAQQILERNNAILGIVCRIVIIFLGTIAFIHTVSTHVSSFLDWCTVIFGVITVFSVVVPLYQWFYPDFPQKIRQEWKSAFSLFHITTAQPVTSLTERKFRNVPPSSYLSHFIGRERFLDELAEGFSDTVHIQAITGITGTGKSMVALKYAYDQDRGSYQKVFWIKAASSENIKAGENIKASCEKIMKEELDEQLQASANDKSKHKKSHGGANQQTVVGPIEGVLRLLETTSDWLLVLDKCRDEILVEDFLKLAGPGKHILVTSDLPQFNRGLNKPLRTLEEEKDDAALLLLRLCNILEQHQQLTVASKANVRHAENITQKLGYLPLAIAHAAYFIKTRKCPLWSFLSDHYHTNPHTFYEHDPRLIPTSSLSPFLDDFDNDENDKEHITLKQTWGKHYDYFHNMFGENAAPLLRLCAFFAPTRIQGKLLFMAATAHGDMHTALDGQAIKHETIQKLRLFSLIEQSYDDAMNMAMFSVQPNLQYAIRAGLYETGGFNASILVRSAECVVKTVNAVFLDVEYTNWPMCYEYLSHARLCCQHIEKYKFTFPEATRLLYKTGCFLLLRAEFAEAEMWLKAALGHKEPPQPDTEEPHRAQIELALGELYCTQGKFIEAEQQYQAASNASPTPTEAFDILIHQGKLQDDFGDYVAARALYTKAATIINDAATTIDARTPSRRATLLNNEAIVAMKQERYREAHDKLIKALHIFGEEHPSTLECRANLVTLYLLQGEITPDGSIEVPIRGTSGNNWTRTWTAEQCYKDALAIGQDSLGAHRPQVAHYLNNLAVLYWQQNRHEEALEQMKKALQNIELCLEHPMRAIIMTNYVTFLETMRAAHKARVNREKAAEINKRYLAQLRTRQRAQPVPNVAPSATHSSGQSGGITM